MNVDIIVVVWGDWHVTAFETSTLPTALAAANLPALAGKYRCRLRIFTRGLDVERIERSCVTAAVNALMPVEVQAMTAQTETPASLHLEWWHRAGDEAKTRQALVLNLPPDVVFPSGCIPNLVRPLADGRAAVLAPPQLRVVEETVVPELARWRIEDQVAIQIAPREAVVLGTRHLHPLFAEVIEGNPFGRPGIEHLWPVGNEGFLLCQTTREIIAYNPLRCDITDRFLISSAEDMSSIHTSTSAEDAFFLSLAPLMKDFGLVLRDHPADARFLARWSTHPDNDVPLADHLPDYLVRLEAKSPTRQLWEQAEDRARAWVREYRRWRDVFHIWRAARELRCVITGRLIGLAAHVLDLPSFFSSSAPVLAFLPSDEAVSLLGSEYIRTMARPGGEALLAAFVRAHLAEGYPPDVSPSPISTIRMLNGVEHSWRYESGDNRLGQRAVGPPRRLGRTNSFRLGQLIEGFRH